MEITLVTCSNPPQQTQFLDAPEPNLRTLFETLKCMRLNLQTLSMFQTVMYEHWLATSPPVKVSHRVNHELGVRVQARRSQLGVQSTLESWPSCVLLLPPLQC